MKGALLALMTPLGPLLKSMLYNETNLNDDLLHQNTAHTYVPQLDANGCDWWHISFERRTHMMCNSYSFARTKGFSMSKLTAAAQKCSGIQGTVVECVLTHEVGSTVPGFFVHDANCQAGEMRPYIYPGQTDVLDTLAVSSKGLTQTVKINDPRRKDAFDIVTMQKEVSISYLHNLNGQLQITHEVLNGTAAQCMQLLEMSIEEGCLD